MFRVKGAYEVGNKGFFCFFFLDVLEVFPFLGLGFLDEWYEYGGIDAGNPENPNGYKTSYLWEQVLQRDSFLDILARFIHIQVEEKKIGNKKINDISPLSSA